MKFDGFDIAILALWTGLIAFHAAALQFFVIRGEPAGWPHAMFASACLLAAAGLAWRLAGLRGRR